MVKAVEGTRRDNATGLILPEDLVKLGLNETQLTNLTTTPTSNPEKYRMYEDIKKMRLDELKLITTGDAACHPITERE